MKKPFQVNDRVRVYGGIPGTSINAMGSIATIISQPSEREYADVQFDESLIGSDHKIWAVHKKQCRRLIPKKRREVWVRFNLDGSVYDTTAKEVARDLFPKGPWIKFVEARKQ